MKFKKIPNDYFITILDRLTRLEPAYIRYKRVFDDIINKFSIDIKAKNLSLEDNISLAVEIFNSSFENPSVSANLKEILINLEDKYFLKSEISKKYLNAPIDIVSMVKSIDFKNISLKNLIWLKNIVEKNLKFDELADFREKNSSLYPINKIILCEGETENILLKTLLSKFEFDLDKKGIFVLPSGGKNQVARKYYKMREYTNLAFFILLDKDAMQIKSLIQPKLRKKDKIYLINSGEFEDLIPNELLVKTINNIYKNEYNCTISDFEDGFSTVYNLENIYKKYGFGEYKKADFAKKLKEYIDSNNTDFGLKSTEISDIVKALEV